MGCSAQFRGGCFQWSVVLVYNYRMAESTERTSAQIVAELDGLADPEISTQEVRNQEPGRGWSKILLVLLGVGAGVVGTLAATSLMSDSDSATEATQQCPFGRGDDGLCLLGTGNGTETETETPVAESDYIWSDEFDTLDTSIWALEHSTYGDGNDELQCYTPEQVKVENGNLVLTAEARSEQCPGGSIRDVTSGMVRSSGQNLSPGQTIEWRVKLTPANPDAQGGLWPALWSSSWAGGGWPLGGEWDGFEVMTANDPTRVVYSIHYANQAGAHGKTSNEIYGSRFSDEWHEFKFDYGLDGVLVWYMDGVETHRVTDAPTSQGYPAPFDQSITEIRINLALGGRPGALDPAALPATLEVDYVRVSEL